MNHAWLAALVLTFAQAAPVLAQVDDGMCRNGMFAEENETFGLAKVAGPGKSQFYQDMDGCPAKAASCLTPYYVLPGDRVVTGRSKGDFVCTYFPNAVGGTAGWMPRSRLAALLIDPKPPLSRWFGSWANYDTNVHFTRSGRGLRVDGMAYWPSAHPALEQRLGGPNMGEISGLLRLTGNRAFEPECKVTFHLLGDILIAADPTRVCDGMNVTFSGVYVRKMH
jgi:hypothetical protein